ILKANPSAVTGYDDTKADLLNSVSGNYQYLSDNTGLIELMDFYSTTTATGTTAGGVAGWEQDHKIEHGETATPILENSTQYFLVSGGGATIVPVRSAGQPLPNRLQRRLAADRPFRRGPPRHQPRLTTRAAA